MNDDQFRNFLLMSIRSKMDGNLEKSSKSYKISNILGMIIVIGLVALVVIGKFSH